MKTFHEMLRKITSSSCHDQMMRFVSPLNDYFGINHFWYYRITFSGNYSYVGTHSKWNEFCFDNDMLSHFPCLRHPQTLKSGIQLMKATEDSGYKKVLQTAWDKFQINFNINLQKSTPDGMEAFGFATSFNDPKADEMLINDLPLLNHFTRVFKERNKKLFHLLEDNQVNLNTQFGPRFYEIPKGILLPRDRAQLLRKMGMEWVISLTSRDRDVLKLVTKGYTASYIAAQLKLRCKTVENYLAAIKCKLSCKSKDELILKAQELASAGFFDNSF